MPLDLSKYSTPRGRVCSMCGRRIPISNSNDYCPECLKVAMFPKVKEFVRENDVNELEVANHFGLDRAIIAEWLKEGRLEHKKNTRDDI